MRIELRLRLLRMNWKGKKRKENLVARSNRSHAMDDDDVDVGKKKEDFKLASLLLLLLLYIRHNVENGSDGAYRHARACYRRQGGRTWNISAGKKRWFPDDWTPPRRREGGGGGGRGCEFKIEQGERKRLLRFDIHWLIKEYDGEAAAAAFSIVKLQQQSSRTIRWKVLLRLRPSSKKIFFFVLLLFSFFCWRSFSFPKWRRPQLSLVASIVNSQYS